MLALNGKPDIAKWQPNAFFSAGTPLSYSRTSGLWAYPAVTLARLAPGSHPVSGGRYGFENAAWEIAQMRGEDNVSTRCVAISG